MSARTRLLAAIAIFTVLASAGCRPDPQTGTGSMRIGISLDRPGMAIRTERGYAGFDIDIANFVARKLGYGGVTVIDAPRAQRAVLLTTGQVDLVVSGFSMTSERARLVTFAGPYLVVHQRLMTRVSSAMTLDAVTGRRLCAAYGSTSEDLAIGYLPGVHVTQANTYRDCLDGLLERRVDGILADDVVLAGYAAQPAYDSRVTLKRAPASTERYGIGLPKDDLDLCRKVNAALAEMISSGAWERSVELNLVPIGYAVDPALNPPAAQNCR